MEETIAGVKIQSYVHLQSTVVDKLVADILGVSTVDEKYRPRRFGTIVDSNTDTIKDGRLIWCYPTLGVLWVLEYFVDVGLYGCFVSNYTVLAHDVELDEDDMTEIHTIILYPTDDSGHVDLHKLCVKPRVEIVSDIYQDSMTLQPWVPTGDTDICEFVQEE
jgi:hypothetical protein